MVADACIPAGERIYAIGDIHGCYDLFERLIGRIRRDSEAREPARVRLILLGDLIDRGPGAARLAERCMALSQANDDFVVLRGNHEQAMLDALAGNLVALDFWCRYGGDATLRGWGVPEPLLAGEDPQGLLEAARARIPGDLLAWLHRLPLSCRIGDYLFIHAGIRPGRRLSRQSAHDMLWIRDDFLNSDADHRVVVVHGHSISDAAPEVKHNRIGIDAGAYRTGRLIALGLEQSERWTLSVEAVHRRATEPLATEIRSVGSR